MSELPILDEETKPKVGSLFRILPPPPSGDISAPENTEALEPEILDEHVHRRMETVFTETAKAQIIGALASGSDWTRAASLVGGTMRGLFSLMRRDPEFKAQAYEARALADDEVTYNLFKDATKGNTIAQMFWLKNRRPKEWKDKHELEVRGAELVSAPLEFSMIEAPKVTPE